MVSTRGGSGKGGAAKGAAKGASGGKGGASKGASKGAENGRDGKSRGKGTRRGGAKETAQDRLECAKTVQQLEAEMLIQKLSNGNVTAEGATKEKREREDDECEAEEPVATIAKSAHRDRLQQVKSQMEQIIAKTNDVGLELFLPHMEKARQAMDDEVTALLNRTVPPTKPRLLELLSGTGSVGE